MLYNNATILHIDYPRFTSTSAFLGEHLLPEFHSVFGFSNKVFIGYPIIHLYPIGFFFLVYTVHLLGFSYGVSLKIVLFLSMVFTGILPGWVLKKWKKNNFSIIMATIFFWFGMNSMWLNIIKYGMLPFLLATDLAIIFLVKISKMINEKRFWDKIFFIIIIKKENIDLKQENNILNYSKLILLLSATILMNYMATILIGATVFFILLLSYLKYQYPLVKFRNALINLILIISGSALLVSFWLIPTILIQFKYVQFNQHTYVFSFENSMDGIKFYMQYNFYTVFIIFIILWLLINKSNRYEEEKDKDYVWFIISLIIGSSIFVFIIPFFRISLFLGINSLRYLVFFEFGATLLVGIYIPFIVNDLKIFKNSLKKNIIKKNPSIKRKALTQLTILIILYLDLTPLPLSGMTFRYPLMGEFESNERQIIPENINYTQWDPGDQELINWIKENTTKDGRILMQISGDASGLSLSGGHTFSYFADVTDRYYATGHLDHFWYRYSENCTFLDDYLYGYHIFSLPSSLNYTLKLYNVEYIIVHSQNAKNYFEQLSYKKIWVSSIAKTSKYWIYRLNDAPKTFLFEELDNYTKLNPIYPLEKEINQKYSKFKVNIPVNITHLTFSLHDFINWHVYINGTEVKKINNPRGLIEFEIPNFKENLNNLNINNNQTLIIEFDWKQTTIEVVSNIISFSFLFLLIVIDIKFLANKQNTKRNYNRK